MSSHSHSLYDLISPLPIDYRWIHSSERGLAGSIEIRHLSHSHGEAQPGSLHFCIRGEDHDGHHYARDAVNNGAVAVVAAYQIDDLPTPQLLVGNVREAMAAISCNFFGHPSKKLTVVGVTGTNGKTTTVHALGQMLSGLGVKSRAYGTLSGRRTTPESIEFQGRLASAVEAQVDVVAAEVTSHGLEQHRVDGTVFALSAFTNLSHEHLDYHGDMESYFLAKCRLFESHFSRRCIVNVSSAWGKRLAADIESDRLIEVGPSTFEVVAIEKSKVVIRWRGMEISSRSWPGFYLQNFILAAEIAVELGHNPDDVSPLLSNLDGVRGRYQLVDLGQPFEAIVDFAHTPSALEALLQGVAESSSGKTTIVFGSGGDRDKEKRGRMGKVAARFADYIILTSDNPRSEDPEQIVEDIKSEMSASELRKVRVIVDRSAAIAAGISGADEGATILIAGKGHEQYQEVLGERIPFQDHEVVRRSIVRWLETR